MSRLRIVVGAVGVVMVATIAFGGRPPLLAQRMRRHAVSGAAP